MRKRRQSIGFSRDQLALLMTEACATGIPITAVVRRAVSTSLAHHRGGKEYNQYLKAVKDTEVTE